MATRTIETKAVISAQDKTGATFSAVAQKLRGLEQTAASASRRMDSVARGMSSVWTKQMERASIAQKMSMVAPVIAAPGFQSRVAQFGSASFQTSMAAAAAAGAGAALAAPVLRKIVQASAARGSELISQRTAGLSDKEIAQIQRAGAALSDRHTSISATAGEGMVRDLRTVVGSVENAIDIVDEVSKLRVILKRSTPSASDDELGKQLNEIVRAADQTGATASKEKFASFVSDYTKARNAFGEVMAPSQFREFIQGSRGAAAGWSREFLSGVVPSLLQTMGSEGGVALQSLHSSLVGGQLEKSAKAEMKKLGLMDKKGRVIDLALAQSNPFAWEQRHLLPALEKHGIKGEAAQGEFIDKLFSDRTARQAAKLLAFNRQQIERDAAASAKAQGTEAAALIERSDLPTMTSALSSQFQNLETTLGKGVTPRLVDFGNELARKVGAFNKTLENDPKANIQTWMGGGLAALAGGHLGLSVLGGYFGGAGLAGGLASASATTPLLLAGTAGIGAAAGGLASYNIYKGIPGANRQAPSGALETWADRFDQWTGLRENDSYATTRSRMTGAWDALKVGGPRSGMLGFGLGGPAGVGQTPVAKLEGAANVRVEVKVSADSATVVREVIQTLQASGSMKNDTGVTMPSGL